MRDNQMKKTEHKRRKEKRENLEQEHNTIQRLMGEMEKEKMIQVEKKMQEKEYFGKMIQEN
jgi:hypothetical protein